MKFDAITLWRKAIAISGKHMVSTVPKKMMMILLVGMLRVIGIVSMSIG